MKALINIDFTNDFVDGALPVGELAVQTEKRNIEITEAFIKNDDFVVFAIDYHKKDDHFHPETKLFPAHNIEGTKGRELFGKLNDIYSDHKGATNVHWIDKTRYSAFQGTDLLLKLRERNINEVHLIGVATDICVLHTAIAAYNENFKIVVHVDAVASFNPVGHTYALSHMQNTLGATLMINGEKVMIHQNGEFIKSL